MKQVLFFFLAFCLLASTAAADPCDDCQSKSAIPCGKNCERQFSQSAFDKCKATCLEKVCLKACGPSTFGESAELSAGKSPCERCVSRAENGGCGTQCREDRDPVGCKKRCAAKLCVRTCDLPAMDGSERGTRSTKEDCRLCRDRAAAGCAANPRCTPGPGAVACQSACAYLKCEVECQ